MIEKKDWPALIAGLRQTLLEYATAKSAKEKAADPTAVLERRAAIENALSAMDKLNLNPNMSDQEFWKAIATKPFYTGHKSSVVGPKDNYMLTAYLSDWEALCEPEWEKGGSRYEEFRTDPKCYSNMRDLDKVIYAARTIKRQKGFLNRSMMAHVLRQQKDPSSREALIQAHSTIEAYFNFKDGIATAFHAMTDLGFKVVKPDRFVVRIAINMGLIEHYTQNGVRKPVGRPITSDEAVVIGRNIDFCWALQDRFREISEETNTSLRSLDYIFSKLGQQPDPKAGFVRTICTEENPSCNLCGAKPFCAEAKRLKR